MMGEFAGTFIRADFSEKIPTPAFHATSMQAYLPASNQPVVPSVAAPSASHVETPSASSARTDPPKKRKTQESGATAGKQTTTPQKQPHPTTNSKPSEETKPSLTHEAHSADEFAANMERSIHGGVAPAVPQTQSISEVVDAAIERVVSEED